jgi:hypothetical protein
VLLMGRDLVEKGYFVEAIPYLKNALEYLIVEQRSTPASKGKPSTATRLCPAATFVHIHRGTLCTSVADVQDHPSLALRPCSPSRVDIGTP